DLVLDLAARIGDPERLAALYLLTAADAWATGPHAGTPWRRTLVRELVAKIQHVLERGDMGAETASRLAARTAAIRQFLAAEDPADVEGFLGSMPRTYLLAVSPEAAAGPFRLVRSALGALDAR